MIALQDLTVELTSSVYNEFQLQYHCGDGVTKTSSLLFQSATDSYGTYFYIPKAHKSFADICAANVECPALNLGDSYDGSCTTNSTSADDSCTLTCIDNTNTDSGADEQTLSCSSSTGQLSQHELCLKKCSLTDLAVEYNTTACGSDWMMHDSSCAITCGPGYFPDQNTISCSNGTITPTTAPCEAVDTVESVSFAATSKLFLRSKHMDKTSIIFTDSLTVSINDETARPVSYVVWDMPTGAASAREFEVYDENNDLIPHTDTVIDYLLCVNAEGYSFDSHVTGYSWDPSNLNDGFSDDGTTSTNEATRAWHYLSDGRKRIVLRLKTPRVVRQVTLPQTTHGITTSKCKTNSWTVSLAAERRDVETDNFLQTKGCNVDTNPEFLFESMVQPSIKIVSGASVSETATDGKEFVIDLQSKTLQIDGGAYIDISFLNVVPVTTTVWAKNALLWEYVAVDDNTLLATDTRFLP